MQKQRFPHKIQKLREPDRLEELEIERVIRLCIQGDRFKKALDVGTGSGLFAETFSAHGILTTGIDKNSGMIQAAKTLVPHCFFLLATAEAIPFASNSFDLVFFGLALHEVDDPLKALQESRRTVTKRVAVLEWPCEDDSGVPAKARRFKPEEIQQLAYKAGFHQVEKFHLSHFLIYCMNP